MRCIIIVWVYYSHYTVYIIYKYILVQLGEVHIHIINLCGNGSIDQ